MKNKIEKGATHSAALKINFLMPLSRRDNGIRYPAASASKVSSSFVNACLPGALYLTDATIFGHHHVHIGFRR